MLLEVSERWSGVRRHQPTDPTEPQQLGLLASEDPAGLTEYRASEKVRAELEVLGMPGDKPDRPDARDGQPVPVRCR